MAAEHAWPLCLRPSKNTMHDTHEQAPLEERDTSWNFCASKGSRHSAKTQVHLLTLSGGSRLCRTLLASTSWGAPTPVVLEKWRERKGALALHEARTVLDRSCRILFGLCRALQLAAALVCRNALVSPSLPVLMQNHMSDLTKLHSPT